MRIVILNFDQEITNQLNLLKMQNESIEDILNMSHKDFFDEGLYKKLISILENPIIKKILIITKGDSLENFDIDELETLSKKNSSLIIAHEYKSKNQKIFNLKQRCNFASDDLSDLFKTLFKQEITNFCIEKEVILNLTKKIYNKKIIFYPGLFSLKNIFITSFFLETKNIIVTRKTKVRSNLNFDIEKNILYLDQYKPILEIAQNSYWSIGLENFKELFDLKTEGLYQPLFSAILSQEFKVGLKKKININGIQGLILKLMFKYYKYRKRYNLIEIKQ